MRLCINCGYWYPEAYIEDRGHYDGSRCSYCWKFGRSYTESASRYKEAMEWGRRHGLEQVYKALRYKNDRERYATARLTASTVDTASPG